MPIIKISPHFDDRQNLAMQGRANRLGLSSKFRGAKMKPSYFTYVQNGSRYFTDDLNEVLDASNIEEFTALYSSHVFQQPDGRFFCFIGGSPSSISPRCLGDDEYIIRTPKKGYFCFTLL